MEQIYIANISLEDRSTWQPVIGTIISISALRTYTIANSINSNRSTSNDMICFTLRDFSGDIEVTAHGNEARLLHQQLDRNKSYKISNYYCIAQHDHQYNSTTKSLKIGLNGGSIVHPLFEPINYNTTPISEIKTLNVMDSVNVIGVCVCKSEIKLRNRDGRMEKLREIWLGDESGERVKIALWAHEANEFEHEGRPIVFVYRGKIKMFGQHNFLSTAMNTMLLVEPADAALKQRMNELRTWDKNRSGRPTFIL